MPGSCFSACSSLRVAVGHQLFLLHAVQDATAGHPAAPPPAWQAGRWHCQPHASALGHREMLHGRPAAELPGGGSAASQSTAAAQGGKQRSSKTTSRVLLEPTNGRLCSATAAALERLFSIAGLIGKLIMVYHAPSASAECARQRSVSRRLSAPVWPRGRFHVCFGGLGGV